MAWVSDYNYKWHEILALRILRSAGAIPRHIALIMDGNRRYAKSEHLSKIEGHTRGFQKLADCLRWCLDIGVKEVTAFAFSIENFKRSEEEVTDLFNLAREKFSQLLEEKSKLDELGVRITILGNITLLPKELQQIIANAQLQTACNDKLFLNVAFSYTSHDEMIQAVDMILKNGDDLEVNDINEPLYEKCLYTGHGTKPDLLIRTSGETRLSDFLIWQTSTTILHFTKVLWPKITIWNFLASILSYQRSQLRLEAYRDHEASRFFEIEKNSYHLGRVQSFLKMINLYRRSFLLQILE